MYFPLLFYYYYYYYYYSALREFLWHLVEGESLALNTFGHSYVIPLWHCPLSPAGRCR